MITGFLHPGAMGSSVAAACDGRRIWVSSGRSPATRERARVAGLDDVGSVPEMVTACDTIVSICPPDQAVAVASEVAEAGFDGVYVDANAVAPATAARVGAMFDRFVDGGIIGPPPNRAGTTRMYLCGSAAPEVAGQWDGSPLDVRVIGGDVGTASALKMAFAAWTKGTSALLMAVNALASATGVADVLRDEWSISQPDLPARSTGTATQTAPKAWRFEGEMLEIADTFAATGLPDDFHRGAAEIYRRMATLSTDGSATLDDVIRVLNDSGDGPAT